MEEAPGPEPTWGALAQEYRSLRASAWVLKGLLILTVSTRFLWFPDWDVLFPLGALHGVTMVAAAVTWIVWQRQAYVNLDRFTPTRRLPPQAVLLGWVIPLLNVVLPFVIMREIWAKSVPPGAPQGRTPGFMWVWWIGWCAIVGTTFLPLGPGKWAPVLRAVALLAHGGLAVYVVHRVGLRQAAASDGAVEAPQAF